MMLLNGSCGQQLTPDPSVGGENCRIHCDMWRVAEEHLLAIYVPNGQRFRSANQMKWKSIECDLVVPYPVVFVSNMIPLAWRNSEFLTSAPAPEWIQETKRHICFETFFDSFSRIWFLSWWLEDVRELLCVV